MLLVTSGRLSSSFSSSCSDSWLRMVLSVAPTALDGPGGPVAAGQQVDDGNQGKQPNRVGPSFGLACCTRASVSPLHFLDTRKRWGLYLAEVNFQRGRVGHTPSLETCGNLADQVSDMRPRLSNGCSCGLTPCFASGRRLISTWWSDVLESAMKRHR